MVLFPRVDTSFERSNASKPLLPQFKGDPRGADFIRARAIDYDISVTRNISALPQVIHADSNGSGNNQLFTACIRSKVENQRILSRIHLLLQFNNCNSRHPQFAQEHLPPPQFETKI